MNFFQNTCKPQGLGGRLMVRMMNRGHSRLAEWGFSHLAPFAEKELNILDAGCGGGANVALWLQKSPDSHVTGLDYSEVSVAEAEKYNRAEIERGRCGIVQGNAAELPFGEETFDCVSAFETVYFWPGLEACFAQVERVLRAGGRFFICNECDGTNAADEKWPRLIEGMHIYTEAQLRAALEAAGFEAVESFSEPQKHWLCLLAKKKGSAAPAF